MALGRRALGQRLGMALAAWGLGDRLWAGWGTPAMAWAQAGQRRLALLIGIDAYPAEAVPTPLKGCTTDVALQRQVLIYHLGFAPGDVLVLADGVATRQNILAALDRHLIAQAQPGDQVVFHFSGYGGVGQGPGDDHPWPTLVAVDGDIPEAAIAARLGQLRTAQVTVVLDGGAGDTPGQSPTMALGAWRGRSRPGIVPLDNIEGILEGIGESPTTASPWPGVLLRAGGEGYPALEGQWAGFSAGVLTYALTQQSWITPDPSQTWAAVQTTCRQWGAGRLPVVRQGQGAGIYGGSQGPVGPTVALLAGPTVTEAGGLWLGGLDPEVLALGVQGSEWVGIGADPPHWVIQSRQGLWAQGTQTGGAEGAPPMGLREQTRCLPQPLTLRLGFDPSLERIERVDATSALAAMPQVTLVPAGEGWVDCLFGPVAMTAAGAQPGGEAPALRSGGYGLMGRDRTLLPATVLGQEEAVKTAITRLQPHFQRLLAQKILRLTLNGPSTPLPVALSLLAGSGDGPLATVATAAYGPPSPSLRRSRPRPLNPSDSRYRLSLENQGDRPLHGLILTTTPQGYLALYCPPLDDQTGIPTLEIPAHSAIALPQGDGGWPLPAAAGPWSLWAILGPTPFTHTWQVLQSSSPGSLPSTQPIPLSDPLPLAQAILRDLATASPTPEPGTPLSLDLAQWVTLTLPV